MSEQNSISIISRGGGQVTGESTNALPVKFIPSLSWIQYVLMGSFITFLLMFVFIFTAQKQVAVVEVTGRADEYNILQIN